MALTVTPAELTATALTLTTAAQPNITSVGTLSGLTTAGITMSNGGDRALTGPLNQSLLINARPNDATEGLFMQINGANKLSVIQNGNVGIGTSSPSALAHVYNGTLQVGSKTGDTSIQQNANAIRIAAVPNSSTEWGGVQWYREFSDVIGAEIIAARASSTETDTDLIFKTSTNSSNAVEAMRIDHTGNVGIGISPPNTFSVGASGTVTTRYTSTDTSAFSLLMFENTGSIVFSADHGNSAASSDIVFKADGATEKMRIASTGIVTIRPDTGATTGTLRLHNGNGNGTLGQIDFGHSGSVHHGSILYTGNMDFHTGGSADSRFFIGQNGEIGINTTSPEHHLHVTEPGSSKEDGIVKIGGSSSGLGLELKYDQTGATTTEIVANPTYTNASSLMRLCVDRDLNANQISLLGNGKIGMGTDTPHSNARLTLSGGIRFSTTPWSTGDALNVISANTFTNYNVANTITSVYYKMFIMTIYSSAGYNQTLFLANGGAGTGFGFTALRPDSATPVSGSIASGFTIDVTGNNNEEFLVQITYGGGSLSVKRTAATDQTTSWGVFIHVLSG